MKKTNLYTGVCFILLSVFMLVSSLQIKIIPSSRISSRIMPQIVAVLMLVIAISLIVKEWKARKVQADSAQSVTTLTPEEKQAKTKQLQRVIGTFVLIFLYVLVLKPVGFVIDTAVYLFLQITLFTPKEVFKWYVVLAISVISSVVIFALFYYGFHLMIPNGILDGILG